MKDYNHSMIAQPEYVDRDDEAPREDHYVHLHGATWADYLRLLEIRAERSVPRITYVEGTLEIMSPSRRHDEVKSYIRCLVEVECDVVFDDLEWIEDIERFAALVEQWLDKQL